LDVGTLSRAERRGFRGGYCFPLARAVMGSLTASALLTLIVLPTLTIVAEDLALSARRTLAWGQGRAPLPWRVRGAAPTAECTRVQNEQA
jgi:hypothetical protein